MAVQHVSDGSVARTRDQLGVPQRLPLRASKAMKLPELSVPKTRLPVVVNRLWAPVFVACFQAIFAGLDINGAQFLFHCAASALGAGIAFGLSVSVGLIEDSVRLSRAHVEQSGIGIVGGIGPARSAARIRRG